jgi:hypothetical protein
MLIKIASALFGLPMLALAALFAWGALRSGPQSDPDPGAERPAAILSEQLTEGLIEAQIYMIGDLNYRIEIQFSPEGTSTIPSSMPPEVVLSMTTMHMDSFDQPLELVGPGAWRSKGKMPMAGMWIMNIGYGEEFAEVLFAAE